MAAMVGFLSCASNQPCKAPCAEQEGQPPEIMNPYGTTFGMKTIRKMTLLQLQTEKAELEAKLYRNKEDSELVRVLNSPGYETFDAEYDSLASKANDYQSNGKLKRFSRSESTRRKFASYLRDSKDAYLFDRYRQVRLQILSGAYPAAPFVPDTADIAAATQDFPAADTAHTKMDTLDTAGTIKDSLWSGSYRPNAEKPISAPKKFPTLTACQDWAKQQSDAFRQGSYAFSFECRKGNESFKQKIW